MSGGDAHAGQAHSPSNNPHSVAAPGGGDAAALLSGNGTDSPIVRGGDLTPPGARARDVSLPGVHLLPAQFDEVHALSGIFVSMRLEAGSRLSDRGSRGDCGLLCVAVALMSQGKLPLLDAAAFASPSLRDHHSARSLRALVCAHGRRPETQVAMVARDGVGGGEPVTFAQAMVSSFAAWISRDDAALFGSEALTVGAYLSLMSISADSDTEPPTLGTYLDSGGLLLIADLYLARIVVRLYDSGGVELRSSPQSFLPRQGTQPTTEVRLRCKVDEHFVLEALETPAPRLPSGTAAAPAAPALPDQSAFDACAAEVARLGRVFRAEQEALGRARRLAQGLAVGPPATPPADGVGAQAASASAEAAAEGARQGRAFEAQQRNLRQAHPRTAAAVDAARALAELAASGVTPPSSQIRVLEGNASVTGRSPSAGTGKRRLSVARSSDIDHQTALALHYVGESEHATPERRLRHGASDLAHDLASFLLDETLGPDRGEARPPGASPRPTDDPPPVTGCAICGGVDPMFGGTMSCAHCSQNLCDTCYPPTQHEPCRSALPISRGIELAEHTCERCSQVWLGPSPAETHADCELCADGAAPAGVALLDLQSAPPPGAPPVPLGHWSDSLFADALRRLTVTEAAARFRRFRAISARCDADIASVSAFDQTMACAHESQGGYYRQYIFECLAQEAEVPYDSVCSMLFGYSRRHAQAVVVLGIGAYGTARPAQAFSEQREDTDASAAATAMRGLVEELLGLVDPDAAHWATQELLTRAHEATYPLVHLGRNPAAPHRVFALHADVFFSDGVDGAIARFQTNSEICALVAVPLSSISGEPGEVEVVDVLGHRHRLRGDHHLGATRVKWARSMLAEVAADSPDAPPPPPPPAPRPPAPPRSARTARFAEPPAAPRGGSAAPRGDGADTGDTAVAEPGPSEAAQAELSGFSFPLRSLDDVRRLRRCRFAAPTDLVGFEFTGAMRRALESTGRRALSVDWRTCEAGGMHAVLDVRDVVELGGWERVFLFPPCFQQLRADKDCLQAKIADCRAFWGCAMVLWCFCVTATLLVVEQPDTIVSDFVSLSFLEFRTSCFRDEPDKFVRLLLRNAVLPVPFAADPTARRPVRPYLEYASSDARDRDKSSWLPFANMCYALARVTPVEEPPPEPEDYSKLIELFAAAWHAAGHPVPAGYSDSRAMPPPGARRYQSFRGPGDGRVPLAVVPSLAAPLVRGGAADDASRAPASPPCPPLPTVDVRTATEATVLLVFVSVLLQPLVYGEPHSFHIDHK